MWLKPLLGAITHASDASLPARTVVLEQRGIAWRHGREVVKRFIATRREARRGHIVAQNAAIDHLGKERGLRNQFFEYSRNILLTFRRERLLIARSAAEGHYDEFLGPRQHGRTKRREAHQRGAGSALAMLRRKLRLLTERSPAMPRT
jgi:hypothetical protein